MANRKFLGLLLVVCSGIFWGMSGFIAEIMFNTHTVSPLWVTNVRLMMAGILLLVSYKLLEHKSIFSIWKDGQYRKQLIIFSLLGMLPSQLMYFLAIKFGNAATATVLQMTSPVFIIIFLTIIQKRIPSSLNLISIIMAVIGTFLLATRGSFDSLSISAIGLIFGISGGLANANYTLISSNILKKYDPKLVCGWGMFIGSIPLLPFLVFTKQPNINQSFILELVFIIVFGTMLAYLFSVTSLKYLNPAITSVLSSFEPLTATVLSVLFLNLNLNWAEILGIGLIIVMAIIQALPHNREN